MLFLSSTAIVEIFMDVSKSNLSQLSKQDDALVSRIRGDMFVPCSEWQLINVVAEYLSTSSVAFSFEFLLAFFVRSLSAI